MAAYCPRVVAAVFRESELGATGGAPVEGWLAQTVVGPSGQVEVLARAEAVERAGSGLWKQLADCTDRDGLDDSAIFCESSLGGEPRPLRREHFLREFLPVAPDQRPAYLRQFGPLQLPHPPRDVWITQCSPKPQHRPEVSGLLEHRRRVQPREGGQFEIEGWQLTGFGVQSQVITFDVFQAVLDTLVQLVLSDDPRTSLRHGFGAERLQSAPPAGVIRAWRDRNLPTPTTVGEVLDTTLALLMWAASPSAPHLEIRDESDERGGFWQVGRGILGSICLQAIQAVADQVPVRPCHRCGRLFLRQESDRHRRFGSQGTRRVKFCTDRCALASAQQAYRARRRQRR